MKKLIFLISLVILLVGCGVEVVQDFGVSTVVFPESRQDSVIIKGTILQDSLVKSIAVHRSGVSPTYPAINVEIVVNTDSVNAVINQANTATSPTSEQKWFKGALALPSSCYQLKTSIVIPTDERTAYLPITLIKSEIDKLDKSKVWMTAFSIASAQDKVLNKSTNINFLKVIIK